jgi:hypothetical protein
MPEGVGSGINEGPARQVGKEMVLETFKKKRPTSGGGEGLTLLMTSTIAEVFEQTVISSTIASMSLSPSADEMIFSMCWTRGTAPALNWTTEIPQP